MLCSRPHCEDACHAKEHEGKVPRGQGAGEDAALVHGHVESDEGEANSTGRDQHAAESEWDPGVQVNAVTWRRNGVTTETAGELSWLSGWRRLCVSRLLQANPWIWSWLVWGRSQRVLPWPSWVASLGSDYTMRPTEASGSAETQGHMMFLLFLHPTGPWLSLGRGLELNIDPVFLIFFHLVVTVQKVSLESSVGRRELGQKLQADAPAKEQSPGHLSLLKINTQLGSHSSRPGRRLPGLAWKPC